MIKVMMYEYSSDRLIIKIKHDRANVSINDFQCLSNSLAISGQRFDPLAVVKQSHKQGSAFLQRTYSSMAREDVQSEHLSTCKSSADF